MLHVANYITYLLLKLPINRLDELVDFKLPGLEERERMVRLYFDKFVLRAATEGRKSRRIKIANFDFSAKCTEIAARLDGLSGREISKLGAAWQVSEPEPSSLMSHDHKFVSTKSLCHMSGFLMPIVFVHDGIE